MKNRRLALMVVGTALVLSVAVVITLWFVAREVLQVTRHVKVAQTASTPDALQTPTITEITHPGDDATWGSGGTSITVKAIGDIGTPAFPPGVRQTKASVTSGDASCVDNAVMYQQVTIAKPCKATDASNCTVYWVPRNCDAGNQRFRVVACTPEGGQVFTSNNDDLNFPLQLAITSDNPDATTMLAQYPTGQKTALLMQPVSTKVYLRNGCMGPRSIVFSMDGLRAYVAYGVPSRAYQQVRGHVSIFERSPNIKDLKRYSARSTSRSWSRIADVRSQEIGYVWPQQCDFYGGLMAAGFDALSNRRVLAVHRAFSQASVSKPVVDLWRETTRGPTYELWQSVTVQPTTRDMDCNGEWLTTGTDAGQVHLWHYHKGAWAHVKTLESVNGDGGEYGASVRLAPAQGTLLVASPLSTGDGRVYLYALQWDAQTNVPIVSAPRFLTDPRGAGVTTPFATWLVCDVRMRLVGVGAGQRMSHPNERKLSSIESDDDVPATYVVALDAARRAFVVPSETTNWVRQTHGEYAEERWTQQSSLAFDVQDSSVLMVAGRVHGTQSHLQQSALHVT